MNIFFYKTWNYFKIDLEFDTVIQYDTVSSLRIQNFPCSFFNNIQAILILTCLISRGSSA